VATKKAKPVELVQITPSPIPPFHQSTEYLTSCQTFYAEAMIKGNKLPGGMESARGNEIHHTAAEYASYCAEKQIPMDLVMFDHLAKGAGPVAAKILSGMRDTIRIDWEHLVATELPLSLDENFRPTDVVEELDGICKSSGKPAHYSGTLDALYGFQEQHGAQIDDYKSHPRPFEPAETLQSKTYAVFVFAHFPWVNEIVFRLIFVRYANLYRTVTYSRQDVPELIEAIKSARERQKMIHADYDAGKELAAVAGAHCIYCPLLANRKCPIAKWNKQMMVTPEMWLNWDLWNSQFSRENKKRMKEYVQETGKNIRLLDYNDKAYQFGPQESESQVYPLFKATAQGVEVDNQNRLVMPVVDLLMDYAYASPEDSAWLSKVQLSSTSLNSYLKTKKRAVLDLAVDDVVEKVTKVRLAVSKPLDSLPDEVTDDDGEDDEF
jgi:hypothetical protein